MQNPFENLHRGIIVKLSLLGGLVSSFVPSVKADPVNIEHLSFIEFLLAVWWSFWTPDGARATAFAAIGGFIGLIYYTGTFFWKRHLFKKYGVSKEHEKEIKREG